MNTLTKQKAYLYAKEFNLSSIRGNLQAYKLVTGQLSQAEIERTNKEGFDTGKYYGSLISLRSSKKTTKESKKKRRKGKRKRFKSDLAEQETPNDVKKMQPSATNNDNKMNNNTRTPLIIQNNSAKQNFPLPEMFLNQSSEEEDADTNVVVNDQADGKCNYFGLVSYSDDSDESNESFQVNAAASVSSSPSKATKNKLNIGVINKKVTSNLPEEVPEVYDFSKNQWKQRLSSLSTLKCWKCKRIGHLPDDCTVIYDQSKPTSSNRVANSATCSPIIKEFYNKCRNIQLNTTASCTICGIHSNLVCCLDCDTIICDSNGHLIDHLLEYPEHNKLYSFKLGRHIKCCKSTCAVMDIYQLLKCSVCLDKVYSRHYNMINALWSGKGLKAMPNTICCEDHFQWHRMNCGTFGEEAFLSHHILTNMKSNHEGVLSELFF